VLQYKNRHGDSWLVVAPNRSRFCRVENLVSAGHLQKLLGQNNVPTFIISPAGETSKNIDTTVSIIEAMEKAYLGRDTLVIALGGQDSPRPCLKEAYRYSRYLRPPWPRPIRLSAARPGLIPASARTHSEHSGTLPLSIST